jgi:glycosyltransferase involved in cell wall biosynthesis
VRQTGHLHGAVERRSGVNVDGVTGLVVLPGDHDGLRTAMARLAGDGDLRSRLGSAGRRRVEDRFTLRGMVVAHLELCAELTTCRD